MSLRGQVPSTSRNPLESLVIALVPSLTPPNQSARPGSRAGSRTSVRPEINAENEKVRTEKVRELVEWCEEIMAR